MRKSTLYTDADLSQDHVAISFANGPATDAFGRLRVSAPATSLLDAQFTYDLAPLIYEQITAETGASIAHDATNRRALMTFSSTPTGGQAYMQSYQHFRYQPGKSQAVAITFNMGAGVANCTKFAGYSDGTNGVEFAMVGTTPTMRILSSSSLGNQSVAQESWNIDQLDGTGMSGERLVLDISKVQIFILDLQALYVGRVRVGFNINGRDIYVHEFNHANIVAYPYIASANLPVRCGMTCTGTVSTTMHFNCAGVVCEGGMDTTVGYRNDVEGTVTASSGARTHILSVRPKTTFNGIANRSNFILKYIALIVTGTNPILWEMVLGQAISGTTTFLDANATYSAFEYNTLGTISGNPAIVIDSGYVAATNQAKGSVDVGLTSKYPITLNAAGAVRSLGTISIIVTGLGGTSACRCKLTWEEVR